MLKGQSRIELEALNDAVSKAAIMRLKPTEAVVWLRTQGFVDITPREYTRRLKRLRKAAPRRLAAMGASLPSEHADAIVSIRDARGVLWQEYLRVRDPPPADKMPAGETLTLQERAAWERAASAERRAIMREIVQTEPYLSAYVEAAAVRSERQAADGLPVAAGHAREVDDQPPPRPALTGDGGMGGGGDEAIDPSKYRLIQDPDNPAIGKWVAIAPRKQEASVD